MYRVHAIMSRADAERLSDLLAGMDPSPAAAVATEEVSHTTWRLEAFCHDEDSARGAVEIVDHEIPGARAAIEKLEDRDWVAQSLAGLPAVHAGPYVVAGAHELARISGGRIPVWIEAGPAFGTGHHGTTMGCLLALSDIVRKTRPETVLDVGTGSGVLAIAAVKSGVRRAVAGDIDAESVRIARENAKNNRTGRRMKLLVATGANSAAVRTGGPYDVVLANILARPLVALAGDIARLVRPGGHVVLSGLLTHQEPSVRAAYGNRGLTLVRRGRLSGWSTLTYVRGKVGKGA
ncbi:MAG: methyltransferase domain-containing protein [Alphaproteobacteria bacterium]|nr:methyltransferase domain-containing protein [Alphaproteobacteria bacterium]